MSIPGALIILYLLISTAASAEILIGTSGPFSGPRAWSGEQFRRGAELAVSDINASGGVLGHKLQLTSVDDASDAEQAAAVARKFASDGVLFVVGHRASDASIAASEVYFKNNIIQISPSSTSPQLTEQGFPNVFRVCGRDDQQARVAAEQIASQWGESRIALIHDDSIYGKVLAETTRDQLHNLGIQELVFQSYRAGENNYFALLAQLRSAGVEVVYIGGYSTEAGLIARQAADMNYTLQLIGGDALHTIDYWLIAGEASNGTLFTFGSKLSARSDSVDLIKRFRKANYEPSGYTLHTYAAIQVWSQAVSQAKTLDYTTVLETMHSNKFDTVLGQLEFDAKGDLKQHTFIWYEWQDGHYFLAK